VPKPRRAKSKSKSARKDSGQLELTEQPAFNVQAGAMAEDERADSMEDDGDFQPPRRRWRDRLWNALAGLSLVPFAWIFTAALFKAFDKASLQSVRVPFWMSHEFLMFSLGAGGWLCWWCVCFLVWKRPLGVRAYVLGHELMHMLMARIFRGRIKDYAISRDGGYIVTDKYNFLIALAPYLWPFYSVPVLAAWGVCSFFKGIPYLREGFLAALGLTWMFHLTFTLWVLPRGQSDLHGPGRIFSITLIYLANALLLGGALFVFAPELSLHGYLRELEASAMEFYKGLGVAAARCVYFLSGR
jgi:hypothetical protein